MTWQETISCLTSIVNWRVKWKGLNIVARRFTFACCTEKEAMHSLEFILLHLGWNSLPVCQIVGVQTLWTDRANLVKSGSRESIVNISYFFFQRMLWLKVKLFENFAGGGIDFAVHFQDVLSANLTLFSRL